MNAWADLRDELADDEVVEAIVFGAWGWGAAPHREGEEWTSGFGEPDPPPVPFDVRGKVLAPEDAMPFMDGWSFSGGFGSPDCYAVRVWTNKRVFWVTQYDGATGLDDAPRHPVEHIPSMPGG